MSVVAFIERLLEDGFTHEHALIAAKAFEATVAEMRLVRSSGALAGGDDAHSKNSRSERNRRYYQSRRKASESVLKASESDADEQASESVLNRLKASEIKTPPRARGEDNLPTLRVIAGIDAVDAKARARSDDWPPGDVAEHVRLLVEAVNSHALDPARSPDLVTTRGRIAAWRRDGASWEHDVIPVIVGICAKNRKRVSSWKYFDAAVAESIAANRQALEIPEANHGPNRQPSDPPLNRQQLNLARAFRAGQSLPDG